MFSKNLPSKSKLSKGKGGFEKKSLQTDVQFLTSKIANDDDMKDFILNF